ncbi:class I SAM-dependent methyltransferase [Pseudogracilibacillus auburnensis]|uniref:S-adenosyl-L-methionine-dependent methyltransferase n=1 Tax=Pseudogracilibacillus auburnensis TaxID=1494959 RepID=A0A2V3W9E7_9BACI|nr:class I SAM-dependent methyltransferase [Pseudogracilibacillus auburnensis]PXW85369.1 methyltransferase (TIGR00027 family) [Pseudogracilibacillus auburnensis]
MKEGEFSLTALISAFGRAYHSKFDTPKIFDDYMAEKFISQQEFKDIKENMVKGIQFFSKNIAEKYKGNTEELLKWITQVQLSPTPLARAAYCEEVLLHEVKLGAKQYVILGAGLDTFSYRHPEFENSLEIFEIDNPTTQQFKQNRLKEVELDIPNNLHFTPMDFTKTFTYNDLINEGFTKQKTFISLLGVSYYLTKTELSSLLEHLFSEIPEGSSIVFDYADEKLFEEKGVSGRVENMVKMAAASGEPMKSCYSYSEIEKTVEKSGLFIYEHLTPADINDRYFKNRDDYLSAFETIHYMHVVKNKR